MLRINDVKVFEDISNEEVIKKAVKKARIKTGDFISGKIIRKSIDARNKIIFSIITLLILKLKTKTIILN